MKVLRDVAPTGRTGLVRVELDRHELDERLHTFYVLFDPTTPADHRALGQLEQLRVKVRAAIRDDRARGVWISADTPREASLSMHLTACELTEREFLEVYDTMMAKLVDKVKEVISESL